MAFPVAKNLGVTKRNEGDLGETRDIDKSNRLRRKSVMKLAQGTILAIWYEAWHHHCIVGKNHAKWTRRALEPLARLLAHSLTMQWDACFFCTHRCGCSFLCSLNLSQKKRDVTNMLPFKIIFLLLHIIGLNSFSLSLPPFHSSHAFNISW